MSTRLVPFQINRLFDRFFDDPWAFPALFRHEDARSANPAGFTPPLDIADEKTHLRITAELPGMDSKDVGVTVEDGVLVLKGEKKTENSSEADGCYRVERAFGAFQRAISLPEDVDPDHAEATFERGVLTIRLPKVAPKEEKKIQIQVK